MLKNIRIENPVSTCLWTSANRAKRFVAQRRAVWTVPGVSIRFVTVDHRHQSAQRSVVTSRRGYDCAAAVGLATINEVAHLPMVAPAVAFNLGKRKGASAHTFRAARGF